MRFNASESPDVMMHLTQPAALLLHGLLEVVALLALEWLVRSETLHHKAVCLDTP